MTNVPCYYEQPQLPLPQPPPLLRAGAGAMLGSRPLSPAEPAFSRRAR